MKYIQLLYKTLEKLPFFNYINRLVIYLKTPSLSGDQLLTEQLENSLLDVFNALGLVIVVSVGFTLYSSDFDYMNSYKIFNPLFVSLSYISYGIFFALGMALLSWLISKTPFFSNDYEFNKLFYTIFCHSLRFYAAVGLFLGTLAIHGTGLVITKGINFNTAFDHWFFTIAIIVTVIWFPIRLYVNPLFKFLNPIRLNYIGYFLILFAVFVITTISQVLPLPFTDTMLVKKEVCTFFKSGVLYKSAPINKRIEMEKSFCKIEGK